MKPRYRKVSVRVWLDGKFAALGHLEQHLFLFLLTHPGMTSLGGMRATRGGLAEEIGHDPGTFAALFDRLVEDHLVEFDAKARFLALPNFLRHNQPENPNVIRAWSEVAESFPECSLAATVIERARKMAESLGEQWLKAFDEAFAEGFPGGFKKGLPEGLPKGLPEPLPQGLAKQGAGSREQGTGKESKTEGASAAGNGVPASEPPARSHPTRLSPLEHPVPEDKTEATATPSNQAPTPGIVVAHLPPPVIDGPWPDDPTTDDPVEWLRQHCVFGDTRRIRDPALVVQQIRNGFPGLDLVEVFREASRYLRSGQTVTAGYERHLKRTAQFAAERKARSPVGTSTRRAPPTRRPDNFTDADFAADFAAQEARRVTQNG